MKPPQEATRGLQRNLVKRLFWGHSEMVADVLEACGVLVIPKVPGKRLSNPFLFSWAIGLMGSD
jgi:hypothetical protein